MFRYICFSISLLLPLFLTAQLQVERSVVSAAGSQASGDLIVDGTLGETIIGYDTNSDLMITSGFHQETSSMTSAPVSDLKDFQIYPNPTSDILHLNGNNSSLRLRTEIVNAQGKLMHSSSFISVKKDINMASFSPGSYILLIKNAKGVILETRSIVKLD